jgi:bifunctional UDP-N-acetylglucosamine pyrophosphorylase/glucosamine-1-phosphate N-acetyltransferase
VGKGAKTGANNTFVAPVAIGDGAMTGGGAVVRRDVPPGALAVSGGPQRNLDRRTPRQPEPTAVGDAVPDEGES